MKKGQRGSLDASTIDMIVAEEAVRNGRDLSVGWVDYRKAYDKVPHPWIGKVLKAIKAPKKVREVR